MKFPILYALGSKEYDRVLESVRKAVAVQNTRNRYTIKKAEERKHLKKTGEAIVLWNKPIPPKPTKKDFKLIDFDKAWKEALKDRPDSWWFSRIDKAIEEKFYRAKITCLIWWDLCEKQTLDSVAWHERMKAYDFDRDLECDWELVEYALHCVGYPPLKANQMSFEAKDRKKWKAHQALVYKCFECDAERTNLNYPPQRCSACGKYGCMEQL